MDFYQINHRTVKQGLIEVYPDFKVCRSKDLMVRGKSFYAIWDEERGLWSTDEYDVQRLVDKDLADYRDWLQKRTEDVITVKWLGSFSSGSWTVFKNYLTRVSDNSHQLDDKVIFLNTDVKKRDYASKRLSYPLEKGDYKAYDELIGTLYEPEERAKLEWGIGSIIAGDAKDIQKFIVLYGEAGAGKSTILNIIQRLFEGYYTTFDAKALTSTSNAFATEVFKTNPLVAIQHDGDLSRIEDNTRLNSIVSHEEMTMNEKYKASYSARVNCFLFMATNRPVKITDAKSGIIRRLIDVKPSGNKLPPKKYQTLMNQIDFELGAIASHCLEVYREMGKDYYSSYRPIDMIFQTDVFFNFVEANCDIFKEQDGITLKQAYDIYKSYCDESLVEFKLPRHKFREELKNYFKSFSETARIDGRQVRSYYSNFLFEKLSTPSRTVSEHPNSLVLDQTNSILDDILSESPAQYATDSGVPMKQWDNVKTTLSEIDTKKLHYVKPPVNHIVIDFDLKDSEGNKSAEKNIEAASSWPVTYAEFSQGGSGVHLHYIYDGDPSRLNRIFSEGIEIKVFNGKSALRRRLSKCNNVPIATINSGLPVKEEKVINFDAVKSEKSLRDLIKRNLNKEIHPGTKPSIDFIYKILDDAYKSDLKYDVTDLRPKILQFAMNSSHQSEYCVKLVSKMQFKSDEPSEANQSNDNSLVFFDVEVFPNLFLVCWKYQGSDKKCVRMINPSPRDIEDLFKLKLIGFNCRRYDNHMLYARYLGYNNAELFHLSQKITEKSKKDADKNCFFSEAYNISYTDIYDFASAGNKKSLKKFEIELGIHHQELEFPWDQPVPEDRWSLVAEYCENDVVASEAVFDHLKADWTARQILADLAGLTVNDTTNTLTQRIIFGENRKPQSQFNYRNLAEPVKFLDDATIDFLKEACPEMMLQKHGEAQSLLPYFPGYKFENGKSTYKGVEVGEGGRVLGRPGMYGNVALLDIVSMHPHSTIAEVLFGVDFTKRFKEIVDGRVNIKHEAWDVVNKMLDGKLAKYIDMVLNGEMTSSDLADALKTAINSVYGLTSASFLNPFKDQRNKDNIVAKRGALFMIDLTEAVEKLGYKVVHIKTDSIKVPDATPEIIQYIMGFGKRYGYTFEHEATYDRMCLVNDAVYIAKYASVEKCQEMYGYVPKKNAKKPNQWTATGAQFAQPYVFKTLFSKEPIQFEDMCETKSVTSSLYLDMNEGYPDVTMYEDELAERTKNDEKKKLNPNLAEMTDEDLISKIQKGHEYHFVGKVGSFCPIKPGKRGGILLREKNGKYNSATGAKDYRWLEAEMVKQLSRQDDIDLRYYNRLVDDAVADISKYGDFEWFVSDDPYVPEQKDTDICPPWCVPCGDEKYDSCFDCPKLYFENDQPKCYNSYNLDQVIITGGGK